MTNAVLNQNIINIDLMLMQSSVNYDLTKRSEKKRSARDLRDLFLKLNKRFSPDAVFEIGAREALFSRCIRRDVPSAQSFAFEANPYSYQVFKDKALSAGVNYENIAISDADGDIEFKVMKTRGGKEVSKTVGNNSILPLASIPASYENVVVGGVKLSSFVEANKLIGRSYSAWIDVEGALGNVLMGMEGIINDCTMLLCEVEDVENWKSQWLWPDVFAHLSERGFVPVARDFEFDRQHNVLFLKPSLWLEARPLFVSHYSSIAKSWRLDLDSSMGRPMDDRF